MNLELGLNLNSNRPYWVHVLNRKRPRSVGEMKRTTKGGVAITI